MSNIYIQRLYRVLNTGKRQHSLRRHNTVRFFLVVIVALLVRPYSGAAADHWTTTLEGKWIMAVVHTDNGVTWAGGGLIHKYERGVWTTYSDMPDEFLNCRSMVAAGDSLWVGGDGALVLYDGTEWSTVRDFYSVGEAFSVIALAMSPSGDLWLGIEGPACKLIKYDGEAWTDYTLAEGDRIYDRTSLSIDSNGVVWAGTQRGLWRYDGDSWTSYTVADGLADDGVYVVLAGDTGVWCGTTEGLSFFSGTSWTTYTTADGLALTMAHSLAFGIHGDLWASTGAMKGDLLNYTTIGGLSHFQDGAWSYYTMDDGLVSNFIFSVSVTPVGIVWCGTDCGASIFTPNGTSVADETPVSHSLLSINANYPNPANPSTTLDFTVNGETFLTLTIRDILGRKVRTLTSMRYYPGRYTVHWDGTDRFGKSVSSGLYFGVYDTGSFLESHKIMVLR